MSDSLIVVGSGSSSAGGAGTPPPVSSLAALIVPDVLSDLRELLDRHEVRGTLVGISAIKALLLAELVGEVKAIEKNIKKYVDYIVPGAAAGSKHSAATSPIGGSSGQATSPGGAVGTAALPGAASQGTAGAVAAAQDVAAEHAVSPFISDFGEMLKPFVKMPVEQLHAAVDSQAKAIEKGAAGITELQTAKSASDARIQALEAHVLRLDAAHRGLSDRVVEMGFELGESEAATEALGEAVREAGSPVIVVVEEGENRDPDEPVRTTQARPMRQAGNPVRKVQARKKK